MEEIWKDIPNYEDYYEISNYGNVRAKERFIIANNGHKICSRKVKKRVLKPNKTLNGYKKVGLSKNGKTTTFLIHLLVARTFIGFSNLQIDHKDGNKENNYVENLEYVTPKENTNRAWKNNLCLRRKNEINQYDLNGNYIKTWYNAGDIEKELGINHSLVIACCKGRRNKTGNYFWKYKTKNQEQ